MFELRGAPPKVTGPELATPRAEGYRIARAFAGNR